jgi:hypothetical protein
LGVHSYLGYQKGLFNSQRITSCNFNKVKPNLMLRIGLHNCIILNHSIWYIIHKYISQFGTNIHVLNSPTKKYFSNVLKWWQVVRNHKEWIFLSKFYFFFYFKIHVIMLDGIVMHKHHASFFLFFCQSAQIYGFGAIKKRNPWWQV